MFLSRIFSSLSPYQGQKLCFLTFLNIKSDFSPPLFYKAWLLPPKPRFLRRFFCSLPRKYRAALCITKCSYPRLLLSWGSYAVKNSALIFLLSYSLVTHLLLMQRFLTYFSTIPYKTVTSALFLFCFLTLRQAEVLTEKILSIFSIFLLAEGISFHPKISTVPISSQILLQTEILTAKNGLCASPLLLKLKELPAIKANQRFLPQKKSFCLPLHVSSTAIFPPFSGAIGMILSFRLLLTGCQPVPYARSRNTVTEIFSLHNRDSFHAK